MPGIRTVLFDLDGTLADTAPDLGAALNTLLREEGRPELPQAAMRAEASHGARALIRLGFGLTPDDPAFEPLRQRFLKLYAARLCHHTTLFPGMARLLMALAAKNLAWGIVTNKPGYLTDALVRQLALPVAPACVVSGDTTGNSKPHPEPLLFACTKTDSDPARCVYVGDAERDIAAGRAAGMKTLVALFGYLRPGDRPEAWGADGQVRTPGEILDWVEAHG